MLVDEKLFLAQELARTMTQFWRVSRPPHASFNGIKQSEFVFLLTLRHYTDCDAPGIRVSDLSSRLQITSAAVSHMINSLEGCGYVERVADPADRRVVLVKPTAKGEQIIKCINDEFLKYLTGLVSYLGEQDSKELVRLLSSALTYAKQR